MTNSLWGFMFLLGLFCLVASPMRAREQPDTKMLDAAERVAHFIETGDGKSLPQTFADDVTILENFPPYRFHGAGAVKEWSREMRTHLIGVTALRHTFGRAHDFGRAGDKVYFSLPTIWRGRDHGMPFTEKGGWAFVLTETRGDWRVCAYGWAVTESSED